MAEPTPSPTPTATTPPSVVGGFDVNKAKTGGYNQNNVPGASSLPSNYNPYGSQTGLDKGTWFLRPQPQNVYIPSSVTPELMPEYEARINYQYYKPSDIEGAYDGLDINTQALFETVARSQGGRSGSALFQRYAKESNRLSESGVRKSPMDLLYDVAFKRGILKDDGTFEAYEPSGASGGSRGGRGGYSGPTASVTIAAESDVRATADAIAMEMIGRGINDEEYQRILKRTRSAEQTQPQVTTSGTGYSATQQGLTAEGRKDIVQNILAKKPEYEEFQKSTTLMDWFDRALSERPL